MDEDKLEITEASKVSLDVKAIIEGRQSLTPQTQVDTPPQ